MGTPGRLCALLEMGSLQPSSLRLLVLDEADQLLTESFNEDIRCGRGNGQYSVDVDARLLWMKGLSQRGPET